MRRAAVARALHEAGAAKAVATGAIGEPRVKLIVSWTFAAELSAN